MKYVQYIHNNTIFYKTADMNELLHKATSNILTDIKFEENNNLSYKLVFVGDQIVNSVLGLPCNNKVMNFLLRCHDEDYLRIIQNICHQLSKKYDHMDYEFIQGGAIIRNNKIKMKFLHTLSIEDTIQNFNILHMRAYFDGKNIFYHESFMDNYQNFPCFNKSTSETYSSYLKMTLNYIV